MSSTGLLRLALQVLESLWVQNVGCSIFACKAVEELLLRSEELKLLHLFNNMSDSRGAQYIADILQRAPLIEDFKMASSRVGPEGGVALAKALHSGRELLEEQGIAKFFK